jgi:ABC-2 type transport system permease protein
MIGDAGSGLHGVLWATPFGWSELIQPYTVDDALPLLPAVVAVAVLAAVAIHLSTRRDVGGGLLASRDAADARAAGLGSPLGLSARLQWPVLAGWWAGVTVWALLLGVIAKLTLSNVTSTTVTDLLDKFGVQGTFARQYLGVAFLLVAALLALLPAGQVGAAADELSSGRLAHLLARPVHRSRWLAGRVSLTVAAIVAAAGAAGVLAWAGARSQGVELDFGPMAGAGLNLIPISLVSLGIGVATFAVAPRFAAVSVYGVVGWSFVAYLLGSMLTSLEWLAHLSLFHYLALAPAEDPRLGTLLVTSAIGLGLCVFGVVSFARRDVAD